jgi:hypothetical protein
MGQVGAMIRRVGLKSRPAVIPIRGKTSGDDSPFLILGFSFYVFFLLGVLAVQASLAASSVIATLIGHGVGS